jgi:hypothetical protein
MIRFLVLALAAGMLATAGPAGAGGASLDAFGWKSRVFLIFAGPENPLVAEQERLLRSLMSDLRARDLVVLAVSGETVRQILGHVPGTLPALDAADLRRRADIADGAGFTAVLIGKDGGVKLRSTKPVPAASLFGLIDSMPMRRREIGG